MAVLYLLLVALLLSQVVVSSGELPPSSYPNPFWPSGPKTKDVDALVSLIMKDKTDKINVMAIPDALERQIYRLTILIAINIFYEAMAQCHGTQILGYELRWIRIPNRRFNLQRQYNMVVTEHHDVDESILENTASRLLEIQSINNRFLPDALEKKLYVNCLKVLFRVIIILASSIRIRLGGHDLTIDISKVSKPILAESIQRANLKIDPESIRKLAEEAVAKEGFSWWWQKPTRELRVNLHASLYNLLLVVMDDLLSNFSIELLSDKCSLELAPSLLDQQKTCNDEYS